MIWILLLLVFRREHGLQQTEEGQTRLLDHCWTQKAKLGISAHVELGLLKDAEAKPAQQFLFKFPHCIPFVKHCYTFQLVANKVFSPSYREKNLFYFFSFLSHPLSPSRPVCSFPCSHLLLLAHFALPFLVVIQVVVHTGSRHGDVSVLSSPWWPDDGIRCSYFTITSWWKMMMGQLPKADLCFCGGQTLLGSGNGISKTRKWFPLKNAIAHIHELVNVNRLLYSTWRWVIYDEDQWKMSRRPSWLDRRRLSNQDFWDDHHDLAIPPTWLSQQGDWKTRHQLLRVKMAAFMLQTSWRWKWAPNLWRAWRCQQVGEFGA